MPEPPAEKVLKAMPTPVTLEPRRWPLRCWRSAQLNSSTPLSIASRTNALDTLAWGPFRGCPNFAWPAGALMRSISARSIPS